MTTAKILAIFLLLSLCVLTGCGGSQSTVTASNPIPTPTPAPPPPPTPVPIFPTQFMYTADNGSGTITGFRINSDGSLSSVPGSPFASLGVSYVKGVGASLMSEPSLKLYSVNSSTGEIQFLTLTNPLIGDIVTDPLPTVIHSNEFLSRHFPALETYNIANGKISLLQDFFDHFPSTTDVLAVDPTGRFIYGADHTARDVGTGPYDLAVISRNSDGTAGALVNASGTPRRLCPDVHELSAAAVMAKGNHSFLYHSCGFSGQLGFTEIDNTNGTVLSSGTNTSVPGVPNSASGLSESIVVSADGTALLVMDSIQSTVDIYALDQTTGAPSAQPVNRVSLGMHPLSLSLDASGQYVYVLGSPCASLFQCTEVGSVFAYKLAAGNLSPLPGSPFKAGVASGALTIVKF